MELGTDELESTKKSILAIEGLFFAVNSASFSPRFMDGLKAGLEFIGNLHTQMLDKIGPEEVKRMREQFNKPTEKVN